MLQYAFFSFLAAMNIWAANIDNTPVLHQTQMGNVSGSFSLGLNANSPSLKSFMMSVSPHQRFYYSAFTVDDNVTGLELGYHPPIETKNFRLGLSIGTAKQQGDVGLHYKYFVGGLKLETAWGPSLHYVRTRGENLYFATYRFACWEAIQLVGGK